MNESDEKLLRAMIQESAEMWMAVRDRIGPYAKPIVICAHPEHAYYLNRIENRKGDLSSIEGWIIEESPLSMSDAAEFFAAFGSHWPYWLGTIIRNAPFRAFIKNGRKEGWSISLDMKSQLVKEEGVKQPEPRNLLSVHAKSMTTVSTRSDCLT